MHGTPRLTPEILLRAYAEGLFPMAERRGDPTLYWVSPDKRGIIPLDGFHVPRRLARTVRSGAFTVTSDRAFRTVMEACAAPAPGREESWINDEILRLYTALHVSGHAHSVECWQGRQAGGRALWRPAGRGLFRRKHVLPRARRQQGGAGALVEGLKRGGFILLDTQFITAHLARFGAVEIPRAAISALLHDALTAKRSGLQTNPAAYAVAPGFDVHACSVPKARILREPSNGRLPRLAGSKLSRHETYCPRLRAGPECLPCRKNPAP